MNKTSSVLEEITARLGRNHSNNNNNSLIKCLLRADVFTSVFSFNPVLSLIL